MDYQTARHGYSNNNTCTYTSSNFVSPFNIYNNISRSSNVYYCQIIVLLKDTELIYTVLLEGLVCCVKLLFSIFS